MIAIINYGLGNLGSIANMLKKIGVPALITSSVDEIEKSDKIILPGVGAFDTGMRNLAELDLIEILNRKVMVEKVPTLGHCLGMQLICQRSEEGGLPGLGWIDAETVHFKFENAVSTLKVPHMGWNTIEPTRPLLLLEGLEDDARFYFVHSYHLKCFDPSICAATTEYGYPFASIITQDNVIGVQFHPEKSHKFGMHMLRNFAEKY